MEISEGRNLSENPHQVSFKSRGLLQTIFYLESLSYMNADALTDTWRAGVHVDSTASCFHILLRYCSSNSAYQSVFHIKVDLSLHCPYSRYVLGRFQANATTFNSTFSRLRFSKQELTAHPFLLSKGMSHQFRCCSLVFNNKLAFYSMFGMQMQLSVLYPQIKCSRKNYIENKTCT